MFMFMFIFISTFMFIFFFILHENLDITHVIKNQINFIFF